MEVEERNKTISRIDSEKRKKKEKKGGEKGMS